MSNMEILCQGWLTKSPPERKRHGIFATFRKAKWRRRYFVLHKPASSLHDVYALDYFRDAAMTKRVGHVDLEQCEQVIASLESAFYQYLFSIRTKQKGRDRTYYLASSTEDEMTRWVDYLCHVCNLKQEDSQDTDIPAVEAPAPPPPTRGDSIFTNSPPINQNVSPIKSPPPRQVHNTSQEEDEQGYIPLDECTTGTYSGNDNDIWQLNKNNRDSLASIPDLEPPPPPAKGMVGPGEETYDTVPVRVIPNSPESQELYNVPPVRTVTRREREVSSVNSCYDIPPPRDMGRDSVRTSSSSGYRTSGDTYDTVPIRRSPDNNMNLLNATPRPRSNTDDFRLKSHLQDPYDTPPARSRSERDVSSERDELLNSPPPRPPKPTSPDSQSIGIDTRVTPGRNFFPSTTSTASSLYDVPPSSGGRGNSMGEFDDVYDIPKYRSMDQPDTALPPPPQACSPPALKTHRYINAATGYVVYEDDPEVHKYVNSPPPGGFLDTLPEMDRLQISEHDIASHSDTSSTNSVELNQSIPPPRQQSMVMAGYADMSRTQSSYTPMADQISPYSVPPPSKNRISQDAMGAYSVPPPARNGVYSAMSNNASAYSVLPTGPSRPVPNRSTSVMTSHQSRAGYRLADQNQAGDLAADTYACNIPRQTPTSRSFKKKSPTIPVRRVAGPHPPPVTNHHVLLPQKVKAAQSSSDSESGSELDDDSSLEDSWSSQFNVIRTFDIDYEDETYDVPPTRSQRPLSQTPPPPPPHSRQRGEIQYLDLDLESSSYTNDKTQLPAHSPPPGGSTPTEYKEIDFIRTAALSETMRDVESSRRSSDKTDG